MTTATIGQRFKASCYDFLFAGLLLAIASYQADRVGKGAMVAATVTALLVYVAYSVISHARWGQTPGKSLAGIKVVRLDGSPLSWRQAFLREVDTITPGWLLAAVSGIWAVLHIPDFAAYAALDATKRGEVRDSLELLGFGTQLTIFLCSTLVEMTVVLASPSRRAIHDLVAGTRVIDVRPDAKQVRAERLAIPRRRWWLAAGYLHLGFALLLILLFWAASAAPPTPGQPPIDQTLVRLAIFFGAVLLLPSGLLLARSKWGQRLLLVIHALWVLLFVVVAVEGRDPAVAVAAVPSLLCMLLLVRARPALR
jgi:uncharacterized RDD family membrane protein YckC